MCLQVEREIEECRGFVKSLDVQLKHENALEFDGKASCNASIERLKTVFEFIGIYSKSLIESELTNSLKVVFEDFIRFMFFSIWGTHSEMNR